jgi:hypothetical protein
MIKEYLKSDINHITMKRALSNLVEYLDKKDIYYLDNNWKEIKRADIHCLKGEHCFRNFLDKKYKSNSTKNNILLQLERFFSYMIMEHAQETGYFFSNPVIKRWDKFIAKKTNGTIRKLIDKESLIKLKDILIEDNFSFVKELNEDFKDGVYNPSRGIILYLMLTLPLRSVQSRLLDSGIKNPKEGFFQKVNYSGLDKEKNYALYINTNKTANPYYINWYSKELLTMMKEQYSWINKYGKGISVIKKYIKKEDKRINPLFLTWDNNIVSRESIMQLWKRLCLELYKREGIKVDSDLHSIRVSLITYGLNEISDLGVVSSVYSGQESEDMVNHYFRVEGLRSLVDRKLKLLEDK